MPRFYVDTDDGVRASYDIDGQLIEDAEAARSQAIKTLKQVLGDALPDGSERHFRAELRDERRKVIFRASISFRCHWVK